MTDFVHLHVHSCYSLEDGVATPAELVRRARELGMTSLALTDHNTLAGVVPFVKACREHGLKPIIGCELNVLPYDARVATDTIYKLVLLVEVEAGYRNLVKLVNRAYANASREIPMLRVEDLRGNAQGLIALSGGCGSELYHLLSNNRLEETEAYVTQMARLFGRENFVFELQDFREPKQRQICDHIHKLSEFLAMRCVATNDVHYVLPEDSICHDFLRGEHAPAFFNFQERKSPAHTRHMATRDQMHQKFGRFPKVLFTCAAIAERCDFQPNFDRRRFPIHDFVRGFDADSFLWDLTFREARGRFTELSQDMKNRLNEEFDYIKKEGLSNNILLLWNVAQFCRRNKITMGVGRGNYISSLVAYILGLTQINPMDYKFRFLGFEAGSGDKPCLSVEVPAKHCRALHDFLQETFGADFCSAVGKFLTAQRPAVAREICAWFGAPFASVEKVLEEMEHKPSPFTAVEKFFPGKMEGVALPNPLMVKYMLVRMLPRARAFTVSDNEFAISGENLNYLMPRIDLDGERPTQMDADALDAFQVPRLTMEFTPILNVLDTAAAWVRDQENASFDPDRIPLDDDETFGLLSKGLTNGIDPFNSITLKSLLRAHRPRNFMQLLKVKSMEHNTSSTHEGDVREHVPECLLTYRCAFIKAHYPVSFMTALLTNSYRNRKKFTVILRETKQMGIRILPPDINLSVYEFSPVMKAIRSGLMVVSGMGEKAYSEIERVRKGGDFNDLLDLCRRTDARLVNNRLLSNLVKTGALDTFGLKRSQMLQMIAEQVDFARKDSASPSLFDEQHDRGSLVALDPPAVPELPENEIIKHEIAAAGYCISFDQLHFYKDLIKQCHALSSYDLSSKYVGKEIHVVGFLEHVESHSPLVDDSEQILLDMEGRVVTIPIKAGKLYDQALNANAPVLVGGTLQRKKDEVYIKALTVFTLRMVQQMSQQVRAVELDLADEDNRTARLIRKLVQQYKGKDTRISISNFNGTGLGKWNAARIEKTPVFFSPPFYYALKKILPEDRINLVVGEEMDPELLHSLSPTRFPKTVPAPNVEEREENSSIVDAY
ncbi:MAG: PHP domain-containing protein [Candidatus Sumerlaeaceae bacterium]|nr:PHP domain-containing protein [Candidatus Sumerlaeaceae bacterium]